MRFMAIEPFFFDIQYYDASPEKPLVFEYPKNPDTGEFEVPNVKWYPIDQEAKEALEKLRDKIAADLQAKSPIMIHGIPVGVELPKPILIPPREKSSPDMLPIGLLKKIPDRNEFSMSDIQNQSKGVIPQPRPSDREPPKR